MVYSIKSFIACFKNSQWIILLPVCSEIPVTLWTVRPGPQIPDAVVRSQLPSRPPQCNACSAPGDAPAQKMLRQWLVKQLQVHSSHCQSAPGLVKKVLKHKINK